MKIISVNDICKINEQKQIMVVNNNAPENILLIGSCRITSFLNYLIHDDMFSNKYNYLCILVYMPQMIELSEDIIYNEPIKNQLFKSKILIGEYIKTYNYFNTDRNYEKCIFRVYSSFTHEIILPNWNDICLYVKDLIVHKNIKPKFEQLMRKEINLEDFTKYVKECQEKEIERHLNVLTKSKWPELIYFTMSTYKKYRLAYSINHPTNLYFIEMYRLLIEKFFKKPQFHVPKKLIELNNSYDFLKNEPVDTKLTYYDRICLGITIDNERYLNEDESNIYLLK
jgi:hypothetical protein